MDPGTFFLPIIGLAFYFFFGRNTRKERLISRKGYSRLNKRPVAEYQAQERLVEKAGTSHLMSFFLVSMMPGPLRGIL